VSMVHGEGTRPPPDSESPREGVPEEAQPPLAEYDWAVLRAVPRVHLGSCVNVGVVVHARREGFLEMRILADPALLQARVPGVDAELLARYLASCQAVCRGEPDPSGNHHAISLAPPSERFHWLTAPRSDVLQPSPVHGGLTRSPPEALERLFREQVLEPGQGEPPRRNQGDASGST
jgi:hypothetical protein